ncbi:MULTISPECIES: transcription initiation factor IIB [Haloprofundus]|uniref:transcription initiation factor IIB n=1 Tax=Haloprofundus TaxID=1911573 RepID=UPI000E4341CB|nr:MULTISPECIES: transcription initiation factor IIB [Haloprofundus]
MTRTVEQRTGDRGDECPDCGGPLVTDTERGEVVCDSCGLVAEETAIDRGAEWRAFNKQERDSRSRVGAPITQMIHDKGLTTEIGAGNRDAHGRMIDSEKRRQLSRMRTWQERIRTRNADERNLQYALSEIDRMSSALGIPDSVREVAAVIYRQALNKDLIRGRSIEGISTSALYAACRQGNVPRSLEEVSNVSRVEQREIGRSYRYIADELDLQLEPTDPAQYLPRFCSKLGVSHEVQAQAREILEKTTATGLHSGKSPPGYAAAAIYAAAVLTDTNLTQREVAEVAQVTDVTIRNRYREQLEVVT